MSQAEADDFIKYINDFLKWPIFPSQEAQIICAMMDGTINKNGAKEVMRWVMKQNIENHNKFMKMTKEEILALFDQYGIEYNHDLSTN